jgi:hypothetical protein
MINHSEPFYIAVFESPSFHFMCTGTSKVKAERSMRLALQHHTRQYRLEPEWWIDDDITVITTYMGEPLRDYQSLSQGVE